MKKDAWLYTLAFVVGAVVWLVVSRASGRREAWDSDIYFSIGMPVVCAAALVFGMIEPRRAWRWGGVPLAAQFVTMLVTQGVGNLLPRGVIAFAVLSIPSVLAASAGAFVREKWLGQRE